ncbi:cobyric acid synthase [Paenibacillus alvei]|nr:cobyric acid synthase [Paenibacillus alvei]MCY9540827.1 cobyric acid synthase [Paenibacillus alvei]MCY9705152.1 cobyric acid synthase [Paenibacillus alvei]MCY9733801.1 cobyric acid synthase [Paenibacillus alvei]MCY9756175.1 cobyric acid synthase [Paenibacillus alvei]MEC0080085.1 cobyric acid synthase [Paenibacillus alvei]
MPAQGVGTSDQEFVRGRTIMLQGTASDVGKSVVTTALCRILKQDGYKVAPFKSQNMALNSYVTPDGKEIGRAQGVQAEACGVMATTDMNPVLLKPMKEMSAQVVVHGKPYQNLSARDYRTGFLPEAKRIVVEAVNRLRSEYDIVVMEGAGSPAEINLKQNDIVNMNMAGWADAPVILVADIDRGGVFASIVGTLELLEPHERERVRGFIINKFRGDVTLLQPGLDWLEERTGKPVLGVLPYANDLDIEAEDSVALEQWKGKIEPDNDLDIAVIALPHISNFTDIDPLVAEPDVRVRYVRKPEELGAPDAIVIPGTKSTMTDLKWLRGTGLAESIQAFASTSKIAVVGICGGYQMLGHSLSDPAGAEAEAGSVMDGLGLLPLATEFAADKRTERVSGTVCASQLEGTPLYKHPVEGYEIHMGRSTFMAQVSADMGAEPLFLLEGDRGTDGCVTASGQVLGTYLHGVFHNDEFRRGWLNRLRQVKGMEHLPTALNYNVKREEAFDRLADLVRSSLNMDALYQILQLDHHRSDH